jgi:protein-arginine kinase activator protein McsA
MYLFKVSILQYVHYIRFLKKNKQQQLHSLFIKVKTKKYHTVGTVPKHSKKIVERGKIDTLNKYMTALFPGLVQALQ